MWDEIEVSVTPVYCCIVRVLQVMKQALRLKFAQHPSARIHLCSTRDAVLVSTYPVGSVWGVRKMKEHDATLTDASRWQGENRLGELLDDLRHQYQAEKEQKHKEVSGRNESLDQMPFFQPVLRRSGSFYDLTVDEELGKLCGESR